VLTGHLRVPYGFSLFLRVSFWGVALTFLTAASDAPLLSGALAYSFCCLDDRVLRRHIHSIPPQYNLNTIPTTLTDQGPKRDDGHCILIGTLDNANSPVADTIKHGCAVDLKEPYTPKRFRLLFSQD